VARFGANVIMDILRTHPLVIIGGILQQNPFFVPPDEFLRELRERARQHSTGMGYGSSGYRVLLALPRQRVSTSECARLASIGNH
jgi:hypothetical protein